MSGCERRWIRPDECAELLGLPVKSVYSLASRGALPATKIGRLLRIDRKALESQLEAQVSGQAAGGK